MLALGKITRGRETRKESKHEIGGTIAHEHELTKNHVARNATESDGADDPEKPKCGDCFGAGADGECCNTCEAVRAAYRTKGWDFRPEGIPQCEKEGITSAMLMGGDRIGRALKADKYSSEGCIISGQLGLRVRGFTHMAIAALLRAGLAAYVVTGQQLGLMFVFCGRCI